MIEAGEWRVCMWKLAYNVKGNAVEKKAEKWRVRGYDHPAERNSVGMIGE